MNCTGDTSKCENCAPTCDTSTCDTSTCDTSNCDTSNCDTSTYENCNTCTNKNCNTCTNKNCTCGASTNEVSEKKQFGFIRETSSGYTSEEPQDIIGKTISDTFKEIKNICNETGCTFEDTLEKLLNGQYAASLRRDIEIVQFVEENLKTCTLPQAIQSAKEKFSLLDGHKMILPLQIIF